MSASSSASTRHSSSKVFPKQPLETIACGAILDRMVMVESSCAHFFAQRALNGFFSSLDISSDEYSIFQVLGDTYVLFKSDAHNDDLKRLISDGCAKFPEAHNFAEDRNYWMKDFKRPVFRHANSFPKKFNAYKLCLHGNSLDPHSHPGSVDRNGTPVLTSIIATQLALWGIVPKDGSLFTSSPFSNVSPSIIDRYEYGLVLDSIHQVNIVTDSWLSTILLRTLFSEMKELHPSFMLRENGQDTNSEWVAFRASKRASKTRGQLLQQQFVEKVSADPTAPPESPFQAEQRRIAEAAWQALCEEKRSAYMKQYSEDFPPLSSSST